MRVRLNCGILHLNSLLRKNKRKDKTFSVGQSKLTIRLEKSVRLILLLRYEKNTLEEFSKKMLSSDWLSQRKGSSARMLNLANQKGQLGSKNPCA
jgi:hypothetical protein